MLDLASATRIHNRSEMSHQPLDGHDLLPTLRRKNHLPPDNLPAIGFSCVAPGVKALARDLPAVSWQTVSWREGSAGALTSRFARVRVRAAHRDEWRTEPRDEEWLLIEWPEGDTEPAKYWLATVPPDMPFERLVDLAKLRWRIERDYQELKQELGLGHYEGRGWRGFHHHAPLCIAAYAFLIAERARFSPSAADEAADKFATLGVSQNRLPRGAARPPRTTCRELDRDDAPTSDRCPRQHPGAMSMLQRAAENH